MREPYPCAPRVVVGIDSSRAALHAAIWAVDEAIDRDVPLCLLCAIDEGSNDRNDAATAVASAEETVQSAITAIESLGKQVKLEAEIVHRRPVTALLEASRSATMICVGSIGSKHAICGRIGSTVSALAASAHGPVAIVPRTAHSASGGAGLVLAVVDGSPATDTVLELSVAQARLRSASLRIFTHRQLLHVRPDDLGAPLDDRIAEEVERKVAQWRKKQPNLDIETVCDQNGLLNHLEHLQRHATPIQAVVVDPLRPGPVEVLLGPSGRAALEASGGTVLICDRKWWL